jgi:hypothetical protein
MASLMAHVTCAPDKLAVIHEYYACFNERRFDDAARLFAEHAVLEQMPFSCRERGGSAYLLFAGAWTRGFPDAHVSVERVVERSPTVFEVDLVGTGRQDGDLVFGACVIKATGLPVVLHLRELLEVQPHGITMSCVSFDFQELVQQLARRERSA